VPPSYYDVYSQEGEHLLSDIIFRSRARSMARERGRSEMRVNPYYRDVLEGGLGADPGHFFPKTATEFSRELRSQSRSPSPIPDTINRMNKEMCERNKERLHASKQKAWYPETYRERSSTYNPVLGRYMTNADSPGFRFYRYGNDYSNFPARMRSTPSRYSSRLTDLVYVPNTR